MFLLYMHPYWREKKEEQCHRQIMVSLDELHDLNGLELDEHGILLLRIIIINLVMKKIWTKMMLVVFFKMH